jgi:micrococcal nuclease
MKQNERERINQWSCQGNTKQVLNRQDSQLKSQKLRKRHRVMKSKLIILLLLITGISSIPGINKLIATGINNLTASNQSGQAVQVDRVSDGDTVKLVTGERVRLCGIDAPEKDQPLGQEAKQALTQLLQDADTILMIPVERDRYGRTVAELFVLSEGKPEIGINGELVKRGLARHYAQYSQNCPNRQAIETAESYAQRQRAGMWREGRAIAPWDWRKGKRKRS